MDEYYQGVLQGERTRFPYSFDFPDFVGLPYTQHTHCFPQYAKFRNFNLLDLA